MLPSAVKENESQENDFWDPSNYDDINEEPEDEEEEEEYYENETEGQSVS